MNMLPNATYFSCIICYGSRVWSDEPCRSCADPDPAIARYMLERLTPEQMAFLRAYGHTLGYQPVAEYDHGIEFYVEADDGAWDDEFDGFIIPHTKHWFANGMMRFGSCGTASFIRYNPMGLLLRECLMAGADVAVPHYVPASGIEAATADETPLGARCTMGVGCDEAGVCYAAAHGQPEMCPRDSGRLPSGLRPERAQCEASQSGGAESDASPNPSPTKMEEH